MLYVLTPPPLMVIRLLDTTLYMCRFFVSAVGMCAWYLYCLKCLGNVTWLYRNIFVNRRELLLNNRLICPLIVVRCGSRCLVITILSVGLITMKLKVLVVNL